MKAGEDGFTVIEVLLAGALSAVILTALTISSGMFLDSYASGLDGQDLSLSHHMVQVRLRKAIAEASEVRVVSGNDLTVTFPHGGTECYSWSGVAGEPMSLSIDGGNANILADGVTALSFSPVMKNGFENSSSVTTDNLIDFETFGGTARAWQDIAVGPDDLQGLCFAVEADRIVDKIVLTSVSVRFARAAGQNGDLRLSLREGFSEAEPRPWGVDLAVLVVNNGEIPEATSPPGGGVEIGWMTIALPESFEIQPNRYYCLLLGAVEGCSEAGTLRVDTLTSGTGPENGFSFLGSGDGGATWSPALVGSEYTLKDMPVRMDGDVYTTTVVPITYVDSVDVTLGMALGSENLQKRCRARVRGAGER